MAYSSEKQFRQLEKRIIPNKIPILQASKIPLVQRNLNLFNEICWSIPLEILIQNPMIRC